MADIKLPVIEKTIAEKIEVKRFTLNLDVMERKNKVVEDRRVKNETPFYGDCAKSGKTSCDLVDIGVCSEYGEKGACPYGAADLKVKRLKKQRDIITGIPASKYQFAIPPNPFAKALAEAIENKQTAVSKTVIEEREALNGIN